MQSFMASVNQHIENYRPIPFWSWNDQLDISQLLRQIRWMKEMGIGGFFMHARSGLKTPYLSQPWFAAIDACCREARDLGLNAWVYDENGWPSGFAGGALLEKEENRDMYITCTRGGFDPAANVVYGITESQLIRTAGQSGYPEYLNLYLHRSVSTADILNPRVVRSFLEITHKQYRQHFGPDFSSLVAGFFTDEPQYYRAATPYTPMAAQYFLETYGQDIFDGLGLLFLEKEGFRAFRYRYWLAMQTLLLNSFAKQIYRWCEDNGVRFTGHYIEETTLGAQLMCCAGVMPFYEYAHIPGIDWLGPDTTNELSPRQLGSAARQLGKKQALTETFAACGWNITPAELRRIAGFQYACGVNTMCHHLLPYSERGHRKRDYPAHFSSVNPWIDGHFKDFNDYFARLGCLLAESEEPVSVAVLHPIRSAYLDYRRDIEDAGGLPRCDLNADLLSACRMLSRRGISYHFLDETLLEKHGFTQDAHIGCGQCSYSYLILPKILTIGQKTAEFLENYIRYGGKLLLLDKPPAYLEGQPFSFDYLQSNCTLDEILKAQPFTMDDPNTELYCAYRIRDGVPFLFVQNASADRGYTQQFTFRDRTASFTSLDLLTGETKKLPLTVTLEKNEALLLFPSSDPAPDAASPEIFRFRFANAAVDFQDNYLTLDTLRYSTDGSHYSGPILCSDLFRKLLEDRWDGKLWLRYSFEVQDMPQRLSLLTEADAGGECRINGIPVRFDRCPGGMSFLQEADILPHIHLGKNCYETVLSWRQREETYYALFGEGVTEALRNCIVYESEIEAVYLKGRFGVYSHTGFAEHDGRHLLGQDFCLGKIPSQISELVTDGFPFFRGDITLTQDILLSRSNVYLELPGDHLAAKVELNGQFVGDTCFQNRLDLSGFAREGRNTLRVTFTVGNRNLLGPHHSSAEERFASPDSFLRNDFPAGVYKLRKFYP